MVYANDDSAHSRQNDSPTEKAIKHVFQGKTHESRFSLALNYDKIVLITILEVGSARLASDKIYREFFCKRGMK